MPRLAIVISAVGSIEALESTLVSVLENRPYDSEIVVALNGPYADPYDLKDEVRFLPHRPGTSPVAAINQALAGIRAPFVHLLASGCTVSEGWADRALSRFGDRQVAAVVPLVWNADRTGQLVAAGVGYRRRGQRQLVAAGLSELPEALQATILGPASFAAFYRKTALDLAGGLSTQLGPRQADVDLALVLHAAGLTSVVERDSRIFATEDADAGSGAYREALANERLFWRNRTTQGGTAALAAHAAHVSWELVTSLPHPRVAAQLAGRMLACCQWTGYSRHHRLLTELSARAIKPKRAGEHVRIDGSHDAPARGDAVRGSVRQFAR